MIVFAGTNEQVIWADLRHSSSPSTSHTMHLHQCTPHLYPQHYSAFAIDDPFNGVTLNHSVGRNEQLSVSDRLGLVLVLFSWPVGSFDFKISCITIVLINTSCQGKRPIASTRLAGHSEVPAVRLQASRPLLLSATAADIPRCRDNGGLLHCRPGTPNLDLAQGCGCQPAGQPGPRRH